MLSSRGVLLGRAIQRIVSHSRNVTPQLQTVRNSHVVSYRTAPPPHSKAVLVTAEVVGGLMWWWILWHLWHEPDHITGEFEYPDPSSWTNAELGIPPDDAE
ncbi:NADH dehydrogenase [ubiquinone] 1 beta subcomplex subunit 2, mitochondrial-like [Hermetia illucens]|uniref:NADH dehydrogenase [ubiquinone] 1 beta subcomplex subunit 2, mitochondrial-like n=1 Tax=Hermetia illucens TaxID=343691 RepID=UPI0018CC04EF|nr:NADH dehydrogenase [ubiquinone] 1 beta subcomplex subunit 2, mitochondrial-like [Hermetia illucens]